MGGESGESVIVMLLREKRGNCRNSPIIVYTSLAKASDRVRVVTRTVDEAIRIPVTGNKRPSNAMQPKKLRFEP